MKFAAIPASWVNQSIYLKLTRIDSYATHTPLFGGSTGTVFSQAPGVSVSLSIAMANLILADMPYLAV